MPSIKLTAFHPSKFSLTLSLLVLSLLVSLRLDGFILVSYWVVFLPFWAFCALVFLGCLVGTIRWIQKPTAHSELEKKEFQQMISITLYYMVLLCFGILVCTNLDSLLSNGGAKLNWGGVFFPLIFVSFVCIFMFIFWIVHARSAMFELLFASGFLFFLFLALQISHAVTWNWASVFSPVWINFILAFVFACYLCCGMCIRSNEDTTEEERFSHLMQTLHLCILLVPLLIFAILLVLRLQNSIHSYFTLIFIPLFACLVYLLWTSFLLQGGNNWWFGRGDGPSSFSKLIPKIGEVTFSLSRTAYEDEEVEQPSVVGRMTPLGSQAAIPKYVSIEFPE